MTPRTRLVFAGVCIVWGVPYLFIKIAVDGGVTPLSLAWARVALGAIVLLGVAYRSGSLRGLAGRWRWIAAYGVVEIAIPLPLIAAGERHVTSSIAAIIIAAVPLLVALLALRFDHAERASGKRLAGLLTGLLGVVLLVGLDASGRLQALLGAGAILAAACGYAAGPMILKRGLVDLDPRAAMGASLAVAALVLTPLALLDLPARSPSTGALASAVVLGLLCTAVGFVLMAVLVNDVGPGRAVVVTYINPVVAVALGMSLLGERPGAGALGGLLLILAGSWVATRSSSSGERAPRQESISTAPGNITPRIL